MNIVTIVTKLTTLKSLILLFLAGLEEFSGTFFALKYPTIFLPACVGNEGISPLVPQNIH
jgi:hypothetical protein